MIDCINGPRILRHVWYKATFSLTGTCAHGASAPPSCFGMDETPPTERVPKRGNDAGESPAHSSPMESPRPTSSSERPPPPSAPMFIPGRGVPVNGDGAGALRCVTCLCWMIDSCFFFSSVTMSYEEASPPSNRPVAASSTAEMSQSSILEKRHLLSNLSSKVSHVTQVCNYRMIFDSAKPDVHVSKMVEELTNEALSHDLSVNLTDVVSALRTDLARFQQQLNMGARFYSFLMVSNQTFLML